MPIRASVLITNYNYAEFISEAMTSALNQTVPPVEVVVVDDGSTDSSREIIHRMRREHGDVIVPVFKKNGGQAEAINEGFRFCTGDVVAMLDGDDVFDNQKLERVIAMFSNLPTASMVMHRYRQIDRSGNLLLEDAISRFPVGDLEDLMFRTGGVWMFGATSSLSLGRSALQKILPIPVRNWRLCADGALAYAAAFLGPIISLDEVLGSYRTHGSNNFHAARHDPGRVQSDLEMSNAYINDFLSRIGRSARVDLSRNLMYRRDRFYRTGGGLGEAAAILGLIARWPLYSPFDRVKFAARFVARAAGTLARRPRDTATLLA